MEASTNLTFTSDLTNQNLQPTAHQKIETYGVFQTYPTGIFNPAFTGMYIWELDKGHIMNEYKICKYHSIKSGIILCSNDAYIFTPISNGDIFSYLKIMLKKATAFKDNMTHSNAMRILKNYVRGNSTKLIIPSIPSIQLDLHNILGISESTFTNSQNTYMILLHRIYLLTFMLHYKMPLQRKGVRGKRNCATAVGCFAKKGWYSYLSPREQKILQREEINVSELSIPDDMIHGVCRDDFTDFTKIQYHDIMNCNMFRDGSMDTSLFQQKIHTFMCLYSKNKEGSAGQSKQISSNAKNPATIQEVPTITFLLEQVQKCMMRMNTSFCPTHKLSWGEMYRSLIDHCDLKDQYPPSSLPKTYAEDKVCSHILHVGLEDTATHAMYLTMLEGSNDSNNTLDSHAPAYFIYCMVLQNPVWDLGLQFKSSSDICPKKKRCEKCQFSTVHY